MKNLKFKRYNIGEVFESTTAQKNTIHLVPVSVDPLVVNMYDVDEYGNIAEISFDGWKENKQLFLDEINKISLKYNDASETEPSDIIRKIDKTTGTYVNYRQVPNLEPHVDDKGEIKTDGIVFIEKEGKVYKNTNVDKILPLKYLGKGVSSFEKLVENFDTYKGHIIEISEDVDFEGKTITIPAGVHLKFNGGVLSNGKLICNKMFNWDNPYLGRGIITANPVKIFELDFDLLGYWSAPNKVYADWYGSIANDYNSADLKDSLDKLYRIFNEVSLSSGFYFTNKGEIDIKRLIGLSVEDTTIDVRVQINQKFAFRMGLEGGLATERHFRSSIQNINISCGNSNGVRIQGFTVLNVGATHKGEVRNIRITTNTPTLQMDETQLRFVKSNPKTQSRLIPTVGIKFTGDSELLLFENCIIYADIGVMFDAPTDFIHFSDLITLAGWEGFAGIYVGAYTHSNILFDNSASINQGLHGIFFENSVNLNKMITNFNFHNVRIEQLSRIKDSGGNFLGCGIKVESQSYMDGLVFRDVSIPAITNGVDLEYLYEGYVLFENIQVHDVSTEQKQFGLKLGFINNSPAKVDIKGFEFPVNGLNPDKPHQVVVMDNAKFVPDVAVSHLWNKNVPDGTFFYDTPTTITYGKKLLPEIETFERTIPHNNDVNQLFIPNTKISDWSANQMSKEIVVEVWHSLNEYYHYKAIYNKEKDFKVIEQTADSKVLFTTAVEAFRLNIVIDYSTGILFLHNLLGVDAVVKITSKNFYINQ